MESYLIENLEKNINHAKVILLVYMYNKGMISKKDFDHLTNNIALIIKKPSFFGSLWNRKIKEANFPSFIVVEQQTLDYMSDEKADILKLVPKDGEKNEKTK